jgi:hypothetical protein
MNENRRNNIQLATNAFLAKEAKDSVFIEFLNALFENEKEVYFYIEAIRAKTFLEELNLLDELKIDSVDQLAEALLSGNLPTGHSRNIDQFAGLIQFYSLFAKIERPSGEIREQVILKHSKYIRDLTELEIEFFMNC